MAHKKGLGSSRNGRDSKAKRLGVKVFAGEAVTGGEIIVRQRGTKFKPGDGVGIGKDDTMFARFGGHTVEFTRGRRGRVISVAPGGVPASARQRRAALGRTPSAAGSRCSPAAGMRDSPSGWTAGRPQRTPAKPAPKS